MDTKKLTRADAQALLDWRAGTGPRPDVLDGLAAEDLQTVTDAIDRLNGRRPGEVAAAISDFLDRL